VQVHEIRHSFTQFTPGNIFRYVENGFRTDKALAAEDPDAYQTAMQEREGRWAEKVKLLLNLEELQVLRLQREKDRRVKGFKAT
jgi:hypothetical protein